MAKYKVTVGTMFVDGVKYRRGDVIETDRDFGTNVEPYIEPAKPAEPKPKAKTTRKAKPKAAVEGSDE